MKEKLTMSQFQRQFDKRGTCFSEVLEGFYSAALCMNADEAGDDFATAILLMVQAKLEHFTPVATHEYHHDHLSHLATVLRVASEVLELET